MRRRVWPWILGGVAGGAVLLGVARRFMSVRSAMVRAGQASVGLTASGDPTAIEDFFGGAGETEIMKHDMALSPSTSTCELAARAWLRKAGFTHPSLKAPYAIGSGIWPVWQDADRKGAVVYARSDLNVFPQEGDIVALDFPTASAHVKLVERADPATMRIDTIDGGALDANGKQSIQRRSAVWTKQGNGYKDTPSFGNVHNVTGWIDVQKYADAGGMS